MLVATSCTVVVPVGVDPVRPEWQGLEPGAGGGDPVGRPCGDGPAPTLEVCDGLDNDWDCELDEDEVCDRVTTFHQVADIDILFVVDPRPDAADARVKLQEALPSLLTPLSNTQRDVHVGLVTMDAEGPSGRGRLADSGGQRFARVGFSGDPSQALDYFDQVFSQIEPPPGRLGARFVTQEALLVPRPFNEGFARDGGYLALVYLSTTEDYEAPSVAELLHRLDESWHPGRWSASAIVQVRSQDCFAQPAVDHMGQTYRMLHDETVGGVLVDHCQPAYDQAMDQLAHSLSNFSLIQTFTLFDEPDPASVAVEVNVGDGFRSVPSERIRLEGRDLRLDRPPPPDSMIRVSYTAVP